MGIIDRLALFIVRSCIAMLNLLPLRSRHFVVRCLISFITFFIPSFKKISLKNLRLVFPRREERFYLDIYTKSLDNLARVFVDFARIDELDSKWVSQHMTCPFLPHFLELKAQSKTGVLIATGHLGSFELMAHGIAMMGYPISFVVRNFKLPRLDMWWTGNRQKSGNEVIPRTGAVKRVMTNLNEGKDVALLFDQNVKRNHAVFVDWFGRLAATTMTLGVAAVRTRAKVVVCSVRYLGDDNYEIDAVECNCDDVYANEALSTDEKIRVVVQRASTEFEKMILKSPPAWFWMHRRWKTAPEGQTETFYL